MKSVLNSLLFSPKEIDGLLCKVLTKNDDSGRHGVLIPIESYRLFPPIKNFRPNTPINYTEDITTIWKSEKKLIHKGSKYKHYHRYPERRITRLDTSVNQAPPSTLIVVGRRACDKGLYEAHVIYPTDSVYFPLLEELSLSAQPGAFFLDLDWGTGEQSQRHHSMDELLQGFNKIQMKGFVGSLRSGSTGVGYTFETMMGIDENNSSGPDFKGIEIKCFRLKDGVVDQKKNLFLQEPRWIDGLPNTNSRVKAYGYIDKERNRNALYSSVKVRQNSHGLRIAIDDEKKELSIEYQKEPIAVYSFDIIEKRLKEKLADSVYIGAKRRRGRDGEEFHYCTLTYYANPSTQEFVNLVKLGFINIELRMHESRNHGTCFRVLESKLPFLYARTERIYELDK